MAPMKYTTKTDEELVILTLNYDSQAYYHLVKRYQNKLLRYTTAFLHDPDNAQDVTQNTRIKAYQNLYKFNPTLKFSSWIYRIAHNEAINCIKKNKRHQTTNDPLILELQPDSSPSKLEEIISQEKLDQLTTLINSLPLKYKEVVTLYYLEDKSYNEISDILRIPKNTVGTHLSRAKQQLRELIANKEV